MKKLLLVIAAVAMLLPSCKKINEALDSLDGRLDKLEQEAIPSIDEQIAAINTTLENLDSMDKELKGYIDALTTTASNLQEQINTTNTKIDEVKAALQKEIADSNAENLAQLQTAKAEVFAQLEAAKTELENELAQINATIATLQEKDKELDEKIKDLNDYVNNELTKTTTWVEATFATLEQYNSLVTEIAVIKEQIKATNQSIAALETYLTTKINADIAAAVASLNADIQQKVKEITDAYTDAIKSAKEEITAAYTSAIQTAITTLDNSLKTWVGEQLANYYTIAQIDAMLATMEQEMNGKLEAQKAYLEGLINELSAALTKSIADNKVLIEGLQKDITTLQGTAAEHASRIAQNASTIATNTQNIIDLSKSIYANKEDITTNEKAIADNKALIEANAKLIADNAAAIKALQASPDASVVKNAAKIAENAEAIAQNAALISANAVAINNNASAIANNTADILQLQQDLASAKAEITEAYKTAINDAITTNNGVIDAKIAAKVETINTRIDNEVAIINASIKTLTDRMNVLEEEMEAIQKLVADFLKEFDEIKETIERILSMIQSVSYVPQYSDGKAVMMVTAGVYDGTVEFDFQLSPKSVVSDIVANWQSILAIKAVYTKTRAVSYVDMPIISCVADGQNGILTIVASGKNLGEEFFKGNQPVNAALFISDGNSEVVSDYVEIVPVNTSGEEIIPANEIWYTSVDGKIVAPNIPTAFNAVLLSNTYHSDKGVLKFDTDVTEIQKEAFRGCKNIVSMILPNTVETIEDSAFENCSSLYSISLGESLKKLGSSIFKSCTSLRTINIPNGVTEIKSSTFQDCRKMLSVVIPNKVTSIENSAFKNCTSLTSVTIPNSVTSIGDDAFKGCNSMESVAVGNGLISIGDSAFEMCNALTSITIPNSVTSIGYNAFKGCSSLARVEISALSAWCGIGFGNEMSNPLNEGASMYLNEKLVTDLLIPSGVTEINDYAFYNCKSINQVNIHENVVSIGCSAFYGCNISLYINSKTIEQDFTNSDTDSFWGAKLTNVVIGNNVSKIGSYLFSNQTLLTNIPLPNTITTIGYSAFSGCTSLTSITVPNSVTEIGGSAFYGCSALTQMVIGNGVTSWGDYKIFEGCTGELIVNSDIGVTFSEWIPSTSYNSSGYTAYYGLFRNSKFTKVTIGEGVVSIGAYAFAGCSSIVSMTLPYSVENIGSSAFVNCTGELIINSKIVEQDCSSDYYPTCYNSANSKGWLYGAEFSKLTIGNDIQVIGAYMFKGSQFSNISLPDSVTKIGSYSFEDSYQLDSISIPDNVTTIERYAFEGCGLTNITIGENVETIGERAFYGNSSASVYCKPVTPPALYYYKYRENYTYTYYYVFDVSADVKIYVPKNSYELYSSYTKSEEHSMSQTNWYLHKANLLPYDFE